VQKLGQITPITLSPVAIENSYTSPLLYTVEVFISFPPYISTTEKRRPAPLAVVMRDILPGE